MVPFQVSWATPTRILHSVLGSKSSSNRPTQSSTGLARGKRYNTPFLKKLGDFALRSNASASTVFKDLSDISIDCRSALCRVHLPRYHVLPILVLCTRFGSRSDYHRGRSRFGSVYVVDSLVSTASASAKNFFLTRTGSSVSVIPRCAMFAILARCFTLGGDGFGT